jgi:hypothetical protein
MRFHPKRRASMDHEPGPNIASAAPATHLSPGSIIIFQTSISATKLPTMGVHNPAMRRMPAASESTARIVMFKGGSIHSLEAARTTNAEPITRRMKSKPVPGQPPANVEYRRRTLYTPIFRHCEGRSKPQKGWNCHSLGPLGLGGEVCGSENYSSITPLFNPIIAACVRSFAPNLERMHLTRLLTVSSVTES